MHDLVVRDLEQARDRTLGLTDLDDPTLVAQHDLLMSPLVWDLAHVGQQEELWDPTPGTPETHRDHEAAAGLLVRDLGVHQLVEGDAGRAAGRSAAEVRRR